MQTKYTPHIAMEIAWAVAVIFFGYLLTATREPYWIFRGGTAFLWTLFMWFAMHRVVVADDAIVLYRRFGWFKRRIPLAQVAGVDACTAANRLRHQWPPPHRAAPARISARPGT